MAEMGEPVAMGTADTEAAEGTEPDEAEAGEVEQEV
jgi:hypothetical protein